jgi:hypothetical protein
MAELKKGSFVSGIGQKAPMDLAELGWPVGCGIWSGSLLTGIGSSRLPFINPVKAPWDRSL